MAKKITGPQILTANRLSDGMVVFLSADGTWRASIDAADVARTEDSASALEARAATFVQTNEIVDPYLIAVEETDTGAVPVAFRERRRIAGPSVQAAFNGQSNGSLAFAG
ncbi:MAG: DUF2849 domain-containing protein [Hyphomicrobiaceae bacterium]|nr:DUF2849 domain-containing protein [Hyphomicrobiaceae bacterium]